MDKHAPGARGATEELSIRQHLPAYHRMARKMRGRARIFVLGLNKTGTTSLHELFRKHRLNSLHDPYRFEHCVTRALADGQHPLARMQKVDAFSDCFLPFEGTTCPLLSLERRESFFDILFSQYPDIKVIVNRRDERSWLESRRKHVARNRANPRYRGRWLEFDEAYSRREYAAHYEMLDRALGQHAVAHVRWNLDDPESAQRVLEFLGFPQDVDRIPHAGRTRGG